MTIAKRHIAKRNDSFFTLDDLSMQAKICGKRKGGDDGLEMRRSARTVRSCDANGNLTSDGTFAFGYDTENRLTSELR
jgi:hypothetical protein